MALQHSIMADMKCHICAEAAAHLHVLHLERVVQNIARLRVRRGKGTAARQHGRAWELSSNEWVGIPFNSATFDCHIMARR